MQQHSVGEPGGSAKLCLGMHACPHVTKMQQEIYLIQMR